MTPCDDIVTFADGELDAGRANNLREHLRSCATCRRNLIEAFQMNARLSEAAERRGK